MARIKIDMPNDFIFSTEMAVRISDINYANHLSNDSILSFAHEARVRFLKSYGYSELNIEGLGIIMTDSAIVYKAEGFYGERLQINLAVGDFNRYGCDIFYQLLNHTTGTEIAQVKTGIVFFDYTTKKVSLRPDHFYTRLIEKL